jgi:malate/lactate dehydrogenase
MSGRLSRLAFSIAVTLSLPAILGRAGVSRIVEPAMTAEESRALERSADTLKDAGKCIGASPV